ncbi:hypothetical protein MNB_SV-6-1825 [hydrothermal vent metagenome]|uniref:Uncharacterized protein n=1 Tax=hydrothermal vent metagenome TaxID=652676 RepID=A0A1W1BB13_9ZZZZ
MCTPCYLGIIRYNIGITKIDKEIRLSSFLNHIFQLSI